MIEGARNFHRAKAGQMRRQELGVKQGKATRPQPVHQPGQRQL
jgi:hypothetical protein